jgi:hypothetical protein
VFVSDQEVSLTSDSARAAAHASHGAPGSKAVTRTRGPRLRAAVLSSLYIISFLVLAWFLVLGFDYYTTPYSDRPHFPEYRQLRPAGTKGLAFGYVGSAMMILMLVYTLRKRTRLLGRSISLRTLLDIHIYFGVIGPMFIVLHTSFKVQGLVAVSFWAMVVVALSGYFGRYLYSHIPRNIQGNELSLQEIQHGIAELAERLRNRFRLSDDDVRKLDSLLESSAPDEEHGALASLFALAAGDLMRPLIKRNMRRRVREVIPLPHHQMREFVKLLFERALLTRRIAVLGQAQRVFHYWHVVHKPFAIIMYAVMGIHIAVALATGYAWVG